LALDLLTRSATLVAFLSLASSPALATDYPPADHGGADLILEDGDRIWGIHTRIGAMILPAEATVTVHPFDPSIGGAGEVSLHAQEIEIYGTLSADAAGYTGGGGGAEVAPGVGGQGSYPGFEGTVGTQNITPCWVPGTSDQRWKTEILGGSGHAGDGPGGGIGAFGGYFQENNCSGFVHFAFGNPVGVGTYGFGTASNNDFSIDDSIMMGSGGGGGGTGAYVNSGGAEGGGCGGGMIRLVPSTGMVLGPVSLISSNGAWGSPELGLDGGDAWPPTYTAIVSAPFFSRGGAGSGGGICIDLRELTDDSQLLIEAGAAVTSRTPNDLGTPPVAGGTVKLMRGAISFSDQLNSLEITSGRTFVSGHFASGTTSGWDLYE
jgi:hypothetical protein